MELIKNKSYLINYLVVAQTMMDHTKARFRDQIKAQAIKPHNY